MHIANKSKYAVQWTEVPHEKQQKTQPPMENIDQNGTLCKTIFRMVKRIKIYSHNLCNYIETIQMKRIARCFSFQLFLQKAKVDISLVL